jgi:MFS family permease
VSLTLAARLEYGLTLSFAGAIHAIAQLAWQPFSSYIIVRIPARQLMTFLVFAWGCSAACMAAASNYQGIYVTRFFLGLFEAGCLPLFSIITAQWYRRSEQPLRVACWYGTNGIATVIAGILAYGL